MEKISFIKMNGAGNDFLVVDKNFIQYLLLSGPAKVILPANFHYNSLFKYAEFKWQKSYSIYNTN